MNVQIKKNRQSEDCMPKSVHVSKSMRANKSKNTKPEVVLRKMLYQAGMRTYRLHEKSLVGNPDICFAKQRVAVFVNGCFWHRCPKCNKRLPKNNWRFWLDKLNRNQRRDFKAYSDLTQAGWKVLVAWECEIRSIPDILVDQISGAVYPR